MAITLKPLEDKIIIKQAPAETTTASGLVIPDTAKEKPQQGEVLAVGPGRRDDKGERVPMDVKEGDRVLYCGAPCQILCRFLYQILKRIGSPAPQFPGST